MDLVDLNIKPAGYLYLLRKFSISGMPNWHTSFVSNATTHHIKEKDGAIEETYSAGYWPGDKVGDHLEFALKYDGINLSLLYQIFSNAVTNEITEFVKSKSTGKYTRIIWFLYEFLIEEQLPVNDITTGNYVSVLDQKRYYVLGKGKNSQRHRVVNNLLGPRDFCPVIRKTKKLIEIDSDALQKQCEDIVTAYSPGLLRRALTYLYRKETKSSFEIEHIKPSASRTEKFILALELAEKEDYCKKEMLIDLQNRIVNPRFIDNDYRTEQNFVGQTVTYQKEIIHYVCPRPEDVSNLMSGLILSHNMMKTGGVSPVIHAAAISYGFVFMHPFEDGNGRIHRFLIHNILSLQGLVPKGLMFPVSAAMLKNPTAYDESLETFSRPLLKLVDYTLDETGNMTVDNDTALWYRYIDMTKQAEALYDFVIRTIDTELVEELDFLANYDRTKLMIQDALDMPDRLIDLFVHFCLQNNGNLSINRRDKYFDFLSDEEVNDLEQAVKNGYMKND